MTKPTPSEQNMAEAERLAATLDLAWVEDRKPNQQQIKALFDKNVQLIATALQAKENAVRDGVLEEASRVCFHLAHHGEINPALGIALNQKAIDCSNAIRALKQRKGGVG